MKSTSVRFWTKGRALALIAGLALVTAAGAQVLGGALGEQSFGAALAALRAQALSAAARQQAAAPAARLRGVADRAQPDFSYTPGALCTPSDPNFKEYRYAEHIAYCQRNVTEDMKVQIAAHYGVPKSDWANYEFDHLIPLAAGGSSSIDNLWPQPHGDPDGSNGKDRLEDQIYQQMNAGTLKQADGVRQIYAWFGVSAPSSL
jgi:hypothetical protein